MQELMRVLNKKICIWITTVLLVSLLSSRYMVFLAEEMTDTIVGNSTFVFLLILLFHMLVFVLMGRTCFEIKKSGIIIALSILLVSFGGRFLGKGDLSIILAMEACASLFATGHICSYFMRKNARCFFLFLGEAALFLMNFLVPVFDDYFITFLAILTAIAFWKMQNIYCESKMKVFMTYKAKILFSLLDIYASFALVGHNAFLKNVSFEITARGVIVYCLCLFIMYPLLMLLTYGLVKIRPIIKRQEGSANCCSGVQVQTKCFLFMAVPLLVISLGYYPAAMTPDGVYQWCLATGVWPIDNSHPAIHTLFLRACSKIAETPYMVVVVHTLLFSLMWAFISKYFYQQCKVKEITLYVIAFTMALLPNNYMMLFLVSKNILYALIVLCTTYLFIRLYADKNFLNCGTIIFFGIDLSFLYLVRHNGFVGTIMACVLLIGLAVYELVKKKKRDGLKICLIVVVMLGSIALIKGPVYSHFGVIQNTSSTYSSAPLVQAAGIFYLADKDIPIEVKDTVDRIGTKEQWLKYYNPYDGDKLGWSELRDTISATDKEEMFKLYFTLLKENPLLVIKARLNAIDILWNVVEPTESYRQYGAQNGKFTAGIWPNHSSYVEALPNLLKEDYKQDNGAYAKTNQITKLCGYFNRISYQNSICNSMFWRNGIYLILLFWLFIINCLEQHKKIILAGLVPFATLGSLALAASWQIYQYYWFFPVCVLLLVLATVAEKKELQEMVELRQG